MSNPTQYQFWLRAYINEDDWLDHWITHEDNIEFDLKDMDKNNWDSSEPILFFEVEVVRLTWDQDGSIWFDHGYIDKVVKCNPSTTRYQNYMLKKQS